MNQVPGDALDDQNRNILFHALPLENLSIIEHLLQAVQVQIQTNIISMKFNMNSFFRS